MTDGGSLSPADVNSELEVAKKFWYKLKSCDFDIVFILEDQDRND